LKGLSGVKTEQGKAGLNVREIKQAESHRDGDGDRMSGAAMAFYGSLSAAARGAGLLQSRALSQQDG